MGLLNPNYSAMNNQLATAQSFPSQLIYVNKQTQTELVTAFLKNPNMGNLENPNMGNLENVDVFHKLYNLTKMGGKTKRRRTTKKRTNRNRRRHIRVI
jgi:hypothetical protein